MIIWGSKGRTKTVRTGAFFCPQCAGRQPCRLIKATRAFTLYFIPLFNLETLGQYVQCATCNGQFDPRVLTLTEEQFRAATAPWDCPSCGNRNSAPEQACLNCHEPRPTE